MKNWLKQAGFIKSGDINSPEKLITEKGSGDSEAKLSVTSTFTPSSSNIFPENQTNTYIDILEKTMEANNIEGPDFYEFYKSLNGLASIPIPENQKYQSAFATLSTLGLTKDKLIESSNTYISALSTEKNMFEGHLAEVNRLEVINVESEMNKLIEENNTLQAKIQQNIAQIGEMNNSILKSKSNISSASSAFQHVYNSFIEKINNITNNIKQYIQ